MANLKEFSAKKSWPIGFVKAIADSKEHIAFRFVIVDNSRSMLKQDGLRLVNDKSGVQMYVSNRLQNLTITCSFMFMLFIKKDVIIYYQPFKIFLSMFLLFYLQIVI
jgi:hypothetical protein